MFNCRWVNGEREREFYLMINVWRDGDCGKEHQGLLGISGLNKSQSKWIIVAWASF